jgi:hypothetical protein
MFASIDFATKSDFRQAVKAGLPIVAYSPVMGMPAVNGRATVEGPWRPDKTVRGWKAYVDVKDMRIIKVH